MKERILRAVIAEFKGADKKVEGEVRYQLEAIKRAPGVKMVSVKEQEPMPTKSAIEIDMEIRERGLPAITAQGLKVLNLVTSDIMTKLANQASSAVARRTEVYPVDRVGLFIPRLARWEAILAEKRETFKK